MTAPKTTAPAITREWATTSTIATRAGLSRKSARKRLEKLHAAGIVERTVTGDSKPLWRLANAPTLNPTGQRDQRGNGRRDRARAHTQTTATTENTGTRAAPRSNATYERERHTRGRTHNPQNPGAAASSYTHARRIRRSAGARP